MIPKQSPQTGLFWGNFSVSPSSSTHSHQQHRQGACGGRVLCLSLPQNKSTLQRKAVLATEAITLNIPLPFPPYKPEQLALCLLLLHPKNRQYHPPSSVKTTCTH